MSTLTSIEKIAKKSKLVAMREADNSILKETLATENKISTKIKGIINEWGFDYSQYANGKQEVKMSTIIAIIAEIVIIVGSTIAIMVVTGDPTAGQLMAFAGLFVDLVIRSVKKSKFDNDLRIKDQLIRLKKSKNPSKEEIKVLEDILKNTPFVVLRKEMDELSPNEKANLKTILDFSNAVVLNNGNGGMAIMKSSGSLGEAAILDKIKDILNKGKDVVVKVGKATYKFTKELLSKISSVLSTLWRRLVDLVKWLSQIVVNKFKKSNKQEVAKKESANVLDDLEAFFG